MEEKIYLALLHTLWFSHRKLHEIFAESQNYKYLYDNISQDNLLKYKLNTKLINTILERKKKYNIDFINKNIINRDVNIVTVFDDNFPQELLHISQVPFVIYIRWKIDNSQKFSVVWTRKISSYGKKIIENIIPDISKYFIIVSGWAAGCDTYAHKSTIESWNKTLSVIWTWIDQDYPTWNIMLYNKIVETGWAILSIFPIWEVWNPYNFPIRNEIVAGLSVWTLVVEAQIKSWTMITSGQCLDLWKDLFAIPWDIYLANSTWCNDLIKKWSAKLVSNSLDILEEYNIWTKNINKNRVKQEKLFSDDIEEEIYNHLLIEKNNINELSKKLKIEVRTLSFKLSMLEISWVIKKTLSWDYEIL